MNYLKLIYYRILFNISRYFKKDKPQGGLEGKVLVGYQGWFGCPGDGSELNSWMHWVDSKGHLTVDIWPDMAEYNNHYDLYGHKVYSSYDANITNTHFKWMKENGIDGVFLQRFVSELNEPSLLSFRNKVLSNVARAAWAHDRVYALMYDVTNAPVETLYNTITKDWENPADSNYMYLRQGIKPVVGLWGFGFAGKRDTPELATRVIQFFKDMGCYVVGGVPAYWRTLTKDAQSDPAWGEVYKLFDVISPWTVGRYVSDKTANLYAANTLIDDLAERKNYMPVIFPGYSAHNLNGTPLDEIPRGNGSFYMNQAKNALALGCKMVYVAMFDECDEATAIYKTVEYGDKYLKLTKDIKRLTQ